MIARTGYITVTAAAAVLVLAGATAPAASAEDEPNLAAQATASASSANAYTKQTADKAIDGVADGYPGDHTAEWASVGGRAGTTLTLEWPSPAPIGAVVLYDRPNLDDDITSGTITFSDGSTVMVPALPEDGEPIMLTFPSRSVESLVLTVDSVSPTTYNIGLAEIEVLPASGVASMLGVPRTFAAAEHVLEVRPTTVRTVDAHDDVRVLRVEFELTGLAGTAEVSPSDFAIVDGAGTRYGAVEPPDDDEFLHEQGLEAGDEVRGAVDFELPLRGRGLLIAYWPEANERPDATWTLIAP